MKPKKSHTYADDNQSITSTYDFEDFSFETRIHIKGNDELFMEWIPLREDTAIDEVRWPGPFSFEEKSRSWFTLLNFQQGLMIPNDWPIELGTISFDGMFNTAWATMPWFAQVKDGNGVLATCLTPWDAGYRAIHPAGGPYTHVSFYAMKSLGKMTYPRVYRYTFLEDATITSVTKRYRGYAEAEGKFKTLEEKAASFSQRPWLHALSVDFRSLQLCDGREPPRGVSVGARADSR